MKQVMLSILSSLGLEDKDYDEVAIQRANQLLIGDSARHLEFIDISIRELIGFRNSLDKQPDFKSFQSFFVAEHRYEFFIQLLKKWNEDYLLIKFLQINYILTSNDYWNSKTIKASDIVKINEILLTINEREFYWELGEKLGKKYAKSYNK